MTINEYAKMIHDNAMEHGFWKEGDVGTKIALIHSELSEALEEARMERPDVYVLNDFGEPIENEYYFDGRKPEGVVVELADAVIRMLDFAAAKGVDLDGYQETLDEVSAAWRSQERSIGQEIAILHVIVSDMMLDLIDEVDVVKMRSFIALIDLLCASRGHNLWHVINLKHKFNVSRPYKHGRAF